MYTVKKTRKNSIVNIFVVFHFKEKQKKWNSVFTIIQIPCKFQQNRLKKVAVGLNGLRRCGVIPVQSFGSHICPQPPALGLNGFLKIC
jgi:hypothetical protein